MSQEQFAAFRRTFEEAVGSDPATDPGSGIAAYLHGHRIATRPRRCFFETPATSRRKTRSSARRRGAGLRSGKPKEKRARQRWAAGRNETGRLARELMINERRAATNALIAEQKCRPEDNPLGLECRLREGPGRHRRVSRRRAPV